MSCFNKQSLKVHSHFANVRFVDIEATRLSSTFTSKQTHPVLILLSWRRYDDVASMKQPNRPIQDDDQRFGYYNNNKYTVWCIWRHRITAIRPHENILYNLWKFNRNRLSRLREKCNLRFDDNNNQRMRIVPQARWYNDVGARTKIYRVMKILRCFNTVIFVSFINLIINYHLFLH